MNAKDLLMIFNGINGRQVEDHERIEALEQQLRAAIGRLIADIDNYDPEEK